LRRGAQKLGIHAAAIQRNVKGCWNLGSCGLGCPTNAKQSMLVTTLPNTLDRGARLLVHTRVQQLQLEGQRVTGLLAQGLGPDAEPLVGSRVQVQARHVVVAGGAINSPALLLRSSAPDPHRLLGRRTFLHPVVISSSVFAQDVLGWQGAPQTIYSDHFLETQPIDGPVGYKLEAPPIHPVIFSSTSTGFGDELAADMRAMARTHALLALLRDGFHPQSVGGEVKLQADGRPVLDYPLNETLFDAMRRAFLSMAELQFAAGAQRVRLAHEAAVPYTRWDEARAAIAQLPMQPLLVRVASAHVMGGCGLAGEARLGVVRPDGRHWQLENLSVHDGSLFPTSIGANPQLSIYGLVNMLATRLAKDLSGRDVKLG
jgi:choline dehydrogenase-like flavoprotein